ncbi:UNVERIFIED_CONTAM: hypothetical protein GTU68_004811 [Idotea baltica]|nr:hypothetical protein [Idotea baltica]
MLKPALSYQEKYECLFFIADLHALNTIKDPKKLTEYTYDSVATWLALGLDPNSHLLYKQSDVTEVTELAWHLSCCTGMGLLEKAHAYKDAKANKKDLNHAVFAYPVLMAADILLFNTDIVPVGKDQKQHVEMTRNIAGSFNAIYGETLKLPEPVIKEDVMTIPGLDGRKMSKSYNNEIPLFSSEKQLKKKIMSLETDSTSLEDPKKLDGSLLGDLFKLFANNDQYQDLEQRLSQGGLGWGHAKQELFEVINQEVKDSRSKYDELVKDKNYLDSVLNESKIKAKEIALPIINKVRSATGLS